MDVQSHTWLLTVVIFSPMAGAILLMLPPRGDFIGARRSAMFCSLVTLAVTVYALTQFMENAPRSSGDSAAYLLTMDVPWILDDYAATPDRIDLEDLLGEGTQTKFGIGYRVGVAQGPVVTQIAGNLVVDLRGAGGQRAGGRGHGG